MDNNSIVNKVQPARLKAARELAGLSQGQVAKMLGIRRPSVSEMESGKRKVSASELARLAEIYDVRLPYFIGSNSANEDINQARFELAARELSKLKTEDLDRVLQLLASLRSREDS